MNAILQSSCLVAVTILLSGSTGSCGSAPGLTTSKYSAEERGYLSQFEPAFKATCSVGTVIQRQNGMTMMPGMCGTDYNGQPQFCLQPVPNYESVNVRLLSDAYNNVPELSQQLASSLAPTELEGAHGQLLRALRTERSVGPSSSIGEMRRSCGLYSEFTQSVESRTARHDTNDSVFLVFSPHAGPSIGYDSEAGFTIDQSISIPTKFGSFTAGHREARGIHALHVVFEGKRRVFMLDRPFEFYLPRGYSTRVSYRGGDELVLFVDPV